ncbi:MAG: diaminopimelate decarboxylase [Bdellovibrionales bacterium]|nr:diaminopimelate decarboxylase [Bdellovibrionales bacterium]
MEKIKDLLSFFGGKEKLKEFARQHETPAYIYAKSIVEHNFLAYQKHLSENQGRVCVAIKANSNPELLKILAAHGAGVDVVSWAEAQRALDCGVPGQKIVFSGVGKRRSELERAIDAGLAAINVESQAEFELIQNLCKEKQKRVRLSFRLNPNVDANTHPKISTGMFENKFGMDHLQVEDLYKRSHQDPWIQAVGIHFHLGSQIFTQDPYDQALDQAFTLIDQLRKQSMIVEFLNVGGGIGLREQSIEEHIHAIEMHMKKIVDESHGKNIKIFVEPGRSIFGNAGILLTQVLYRKQTSHKTFVIVDAGMNDYMRPALYEAPVHLEYLGESKNHETMDLVGPVCESTDTFAKNITFTVCMQGDILAMMHVGAYGYSMSSHYNLRSRPAEFLWDGAQYRCIQEEILA